MTENLIHKSYNTIICTNSKARWNKWKHRNYSP